MPSSSSFYSGNSSTADHYIGQQQFQQYQSLSTSSSYQQAEELSSMSFNVQLNSVPRSPSYNLTEDANNNSLGLGDTSMTKSDSGHIIMSDGKKGSITSLGTPASSTHSSPHKNLAGDPNSLNLSLANEHSNSTNNSFNNVTFQ
jgi:hypothetical protein